MPSRVKIHFWSLIGSSSGSSSVSETPQRSDMLLGPSLQRSDLLGPEVLVPGTRTSSATLYVLISFVFDGVT